MSDDRKSVSEVKRVLAKEITTDHPLEQFFDMEEGNTEVQIYERQTNLVENAAQYDDKDAELETHFQDIADTSLSLVDMLKDMIPTAEPKYKARLVEVAGQQLNIAMSAIERRARLKEHKDKLDMRKLAIEKKGSSTTNNFLVVGDRNEILRQARLAALESQKSEDIVLEAQIIDQKDAKDE